MRQVVERALSHIIQMQGWAASWRDRGEELLKSLYQTRARLERRLSAIIAIGQ